MSIIYGIFSPSGAAIDPAWGEAMDKLADLWPADRRNCTNAPAGYLACGQRFNTPEAQYAEQPLAIACEDDHFFQLIFDGRLDNRDELAASLGVALTATTTDESLIAGAYQKYGGELGKHLLGDFALAVIDQRDNSLFLLRDHMGVRPLYITENDDFIAFASSPAILLALPWVDDTPDRQWLADFLTVTKVDYTTTCYQGIRAVHAAHSFRADRKGRHLHRYWDLEYRNNAAPADDEACIAEFRRLLFQAVECRLRSHGQAGSEMSGGLDSTTVTAIASELLKKSGRQIHAWSHVLHEDYKGRVFPFQDEREYMDLLLNQHPNIVHHPVFSKGRDVLGVLADRLQVHGGPFRNDLTQFSDQTGEELHTVDIRTLLSGFGGDQLVTSHGVGIYEDLTANRDFDTIRTYIAQEKTPLHRRVLKSLALRFVPALAKRYMQRPKKTEFDPIIRMDWLRNFGYPQRADAHPTRPRAGTIRQREYHVIRSPHVVYRLQDSAIGAASYGVDYRYPLLDIRLLQFCLDMGHHQKRRPDMRRRMIRMATKGLLPDKLRLRHDKSGATIPTFYHRYLTDQQNIDELLANPLVERELADMIDLDRLRKDFAAMTEETRTVARSGERALKLALWAIQDKSRPTEKAQP